MRLLDLDNGWIFLGLDCHGYNLLPSFNAAQTTVMRATTTDLGPIWTTSVTGVHCDGNLSHQSPLFFILSHLSLPNARAGFCDCGFSL